jgi:S-methylmethionine-dependent homocysteine/selenocysteine methylase
MGQELRHRGVQGTNTLWSAHALISAPEIVQAVHEDYIKAGANIITTNTYATIRRRLARAGIEDQFASLNQLAGELACQAREASGHDVLIAGSLPPLRGSYRPDLVGSFDEIESVYREQAELLAPYVDILLCETMSSGEESHAAVTGAAVGKPVWVAWTLEDGGATRLRSGETIAEAAAMLDGLPVSAFLVNCCAPESITAAMPELSALGSWPVGGYANGFVSIPDKWLFKDGVPTPDVRNDLDPLTYTSYVEDWISSGARIVGGCCEVGPDHISRLRGLVDAALQS